MSRRVVRSLLQPSRCFGPKIQESWSVILKIDPKLFANLNTAGQNEKQRLDSKADQQSDSKVDQQSEEGVDKQFEDLKKFVHTAYFLTTRGYLKEEAFVNFLLDHPLHCQMGPIAKSWLNLFDKMEFKKSLHPSSDAEAFVTKLAIKVLLFQKVFGKDLKSVKDGEPMDALSNFVVNYDKISNPGKDKLPSPVKNLLLPDTTAYGEWALQDLTADCAANVFPLDKKHGAVSSARFCRFSLRWMSIARFDCGLCGKCFPFGRKAQCCLVYSLLMLFLTMCDVFTSWCCCFFSFVLSQSRLCFCVLAVLIGRTLKVPFCVLCAHYRIINGVDLVPFQGVLIFSACLRS